MSEHGCFVGVGRVIANGDRGVASGVDLGLVMGEGHATKIATEVFAVDFEVEAGLDLVGGSGGGELCVGGQDVPVVNFCRGLGPLGGEA